MGDSPAFNTLGTNKVRGEANSNFQNGEETDTSRTSSTPRKVLTEEEKSKLKIRARRLSGSVEDKNKLNPLTPSTPSKKRVKKKLTLEESAKSCQDIRCHFKEGLSTEQETTNTSNKEVSQIDAGNTPALYNITTIQEDIDINRPEYMLSTKTAMNMALNGTIAEQEKLQQNGKDEEEVTFKNPKKAEDPLEVNTKDLTPESKKLLDVMSVILNKHKEDLKRDLKSDINASLVQFTKLTESHNTVSDSVTTIKSGHDSLVKDNKGLKKEINELKDRVNKLTNTVIRQGAIMGEIRSNKEVEDVRSMKKDLIICGLKENKGEQCSVIVNNFFKDTMKITTYIKVCWHGFNA